MNNISPVSEIILPILLALLTSLIPVYFGLKFGQQKNSRVETKLEIIKVATSDIREYSQQTKSIGESKDLIDFIVHKLPILVTEIENKFLETVMINLKNEPAVTRSFLKLHYADPEARKEILGIFFMDGKSHESFDELSDEDILNFIKITERNLESIKTQENS